MFCFLAVIGKMQVREVGHNPNTALKSFNVKNVTRNSSTKNCLTFLKSLKFLKKIFFVCLNGRVTETDQSCGSLGKVATTAWAGASWIQEPGTPSASPTQHQELQWLSCGLLLSDALARSWIWSGIDGTWGSTLLGVSGIPRVAQTTAPQCQPYSFNLPNT